MSLILPSKYFNSLQLSLADVCYRCTDLAWNMQNRQATIKVEYFSSVDTALTPGSLPIFTEYIRIDDYDSTLIEGLAEGWLLTQPEFVNSETLSQYNSRINGIDGYGVVDGYV